MDDPRLAIEDLANLGGVSRRTVRYYIQEGLLPPPLGVGRGRHYDRTHLDRLLLVRQLQESGRSLDDIRTAITRRAADVTDRPAPAAPGLPAPARSLWRRLTLAPGVELHIAQDRRLPPPRRLAELSDWCRVHFAPADNDDEGEHDA